MSALEEMFELHLRALKLYGYTREYQFHPTRKWRFDFAFVDQKIAVELHGGVFTQGRHTRGLGVENDMRKINAAILLGWSVLCFSSGMVKNGEAAAQVEIMLTKLKEGTAS